MVFDICLFLQLRVKSYFFQQLEFLLKLDLGGYSTFFVVLLYQNRSENVGFWRPQATEACISKVKSPRMGLTQKVKSLKMDLPITPRQFLKQPTRFQYIWPR